MTETGGGGLACAYCGQRHSHAAEVRACWERANRPNLPPGGASEWGPYDGPELPQAVQAGWPELDESGPRRPRLGRSDAGAMGPTGTAGPVLGRSVLVAPGQTPPRAWTQCERFSGGIDELEQAWRERTPLVIEVGEEPPADEVERRAVWSLAPTFAFPGERHTHALSNAVDARYGTTRWPLAEAAVRLGARLGGSADLVLPDGTSAYCDGGLFEWRTEMGGAAIVPRISLLAGSLLPIGPNHTDAKLAADQLAAVLHDGGAARIIAPAGSGKTRVLTERARHLLRQGNVPGRAVTLIAYNRRAADEMRERTPDLPELHIRTLNAIGLAQLTHSGPVTTIEERDVRTILDGLVDLPRRANSDPAVAWIEALSAVRLGLRSPAEIETEFGGDVDGLPQVFDRYRSVLAARGLVDFDEQIYRSIELLLTNPAERQAARTSCRMLLVDEFQDLTPAHLLLVRLLAGPDGAVFGVGDDDQTIYGYSGASPEWLIGYRRFFPTAVEHPLEVNYRCPVPVVQAAKTLLTHNRHRVDKRIVAAPGRASDDGALEVTTSDDALAVTVETVVGLVSGPAAPNEVAVLTRVNASLAAVQVALVHREIPVRPALGPSYLARGGVQAALGWLRLALAPPERLAGPDVATTARRPSRALSTKVIGWMAEQRSVVELEGLAGRVRERDADKILNYVSDLRSVQRRAASGSTSAVLGTVRHEVGLDRAMEVLEGSHRYVDRSAQTDDLDALLTLAALHPEPAGFEEWLRRALSNPGSPDGVVLSTIHAVKGREWPHVVLHDASSGLFPHRLAGDLEEERRVFHVGLTRARTSVHVVAGPSPSPFLAELVEEWTPSRPGLPGPHPRAVAAGPGRASRSTGASNKARPVKDEPSVAAAVGLEFDHGGHRQRVVAIDDEGVRVSVGRAQMRVAYGELVGVEGRSVRLVPEAAPDEVIDRVRQALRGWRTLRATSEGKPAYVYLVDRTVEELAVRMPSTMAALAKVNGIGPAKLESYGDELLAIIAEAKDA